MMRETLLDGMNGMSGMTRVACRSACMSNSMGSGVQGSGCSGRLGCVDTR